MYEAFEIPDGLGAGLFVRSGTRAVVFGLARPDSHTLSARWGADTPNLRDEIAIAAVWRDVYECRDVLRRMAEPKRPESVLISQFKCGTEPAFLSRQSFNRLTIIPPKRSL